MIVVNCFIMSNGKAATKRNVKTSLAGFPFSALKGS